MPNGEKDKIDRFSKNDHKGLINQQWHYIKKYMS